MEADIEILDIIPRKWDSRKLNSHLVLKLKRMRPLLYKKLKVVCII